MASRVADGLSKLQLDDSLDSSGDDAVPFLGTNEGARRPSVGQKKKGLDSSSDLSSSVSTDLSSDSDDSDSDDSDEPTTTATTTRTRPSKNGNATTTKRTAGGHRAAAAAAADPKGKGKAGDKDQEDQEAKKKEEEKNAAAKKSLDYSVFVTNYEIDPKDIKLGDLLGSGSYGKVYKAKLYAKDVAVKKLTTKFLDEKALRAFGHEVDIMCNLRHPNVVLFMGACTTPGNLTIITELMSKGSVTDLLRDKSLKLSFKQRMSFARDAALGMNWLHNASPPILHLDLKCSNLLVNDDWEVKVADFGLAKINASGTHRGLHGSPIYMSPEMLLGLEYDEKTDIYSFGMVLYELATGEEPFKNEFSSLQSLIDAVVKKNERPKIPATCPVRLAKLIRSCWDTVPSKRPAFVDMLSSNVFYKVSLEATLRDKRACALWAQYFLTRETVTWNEFQQAFTDFFNIKARNGADANRLELVRVLVAKDRDMVGIEQFARALECFGPLETPAQFLDEIEGTLREEWFHGDVTEAEAELLLAKHKHGTYLVRFSSTPGSFTITGKNKKDALAHFRISHKAGLAFCLGANEYVRPCPGSAYQTLFDPKAAVTSVRPSFYSAQDYQYS
ncbi:Dual specificity protein kinase shkC, putative [Acanthamoeba castellanii str. Neff]|uniref:non-specific serine/threonine protein kinase n=1 Tax=Acanthamoeba castellanii (strain ATCC 30010 / Neff) TaxID=1257118 RepID=L8HJF2_ACACF|nr:Dual specificity protein kinase shkC, putative [Acanthamoeba castellanii str. Neff]ELR25342.1 Dual specificity protein kinase shkC, putative [Acanthamoeba castellanii str. Neff]